MFEARLAEGGILKKVLDAIKDLLNEASFDCKFTPFFFFFFDVDSAYLTYYRCRDLVSV